MKKNRGFTILELLVATSIIAIVFGLGVARYNQFNRRQMVVQAAKELETNLRLAQGKATAGEKDCSACQGDDDVCGNQDDLALDGWYISFSPDSYEVYGQCGSNSFSAKPPIDLSGKNITLSLNPPSVNPIWFKPLGLGVEEAVIITLTGYGTSETVNVNKAGEIY